MSWDGFKHILGSYLGIKTKFNNYLNKHETGVVWRAKTQAEQVREFITAFLDGFDDPEVCEQRMPLSERYVFARSRT